ncbi:hypothetical protein WUBG_06500 [Wuchereria bancrofti]|uniref:Uncharacterized protein n=1 Tax=Wuchereria bancrofti TaxID=6293 RepID=J9B6E9_WUCBA|nr:hypothetical protein WUBG_06500 [Wuchereria bancrofti]
MAGNVNVGRGLWRERSEKRRSYCVCTQGKTTDGRWEAFFFFPPLLNLKSTRDLTAATEWKETLSAEIWIRGKNSRTIHRLEVLELYHAKECYSNIQIPLIKEKFVPLRDILAQWQNYVTKKKSRIAHSHRTDRTDKTTTSSRQTHHHAYTIELITMAQVQTCIVE